MRVGFIGLGNMGQPMAANILRAGHELTIHDTRRQTGRDLEAAGAAWVDNAKAVSVRSDVVLSSLPDGEAVEDVALGDEGVFCRSCRGVDLRRHQHRRTGRDAPHFRAWRRTRFARARRAGQRRHLWRGVRGRSRCSSAVKRRICNGCGPVLTCIGDRIVHAGPAGSGNVVKLINNLMMFVNFVGVCEGVAMGARAGIDLNRLLDGGESEYGSESDFRTHALPVPGR